MVSRRFKFQILPLLTIILFTNLFFITNSFALTYSNPSTTPLWSYSLGNQYASAVEISDDGIYIIATSENLRTNINQKSYGTLYLFNNSISDKKKPLWNYSILDDFFSIAISGNGSNIIAGGGYEEDKIFIFNNSNPKPKGTYFTYGINYDVTITEDGYYTAAACGISEMAVLINNSKFDLIRRYNTKGLALRVALSSNGAYMAVTDNAGKLYFFNTSKNSPDWNFTVEDDMSIALSMSTDGNYIASGGDKVYVFNKISSTPIWTYNTPDEIRVIKISQNGNYIVAGGGYTDYNIYFFHRSKPSPEWTYLTKGEISSVAISENGDYIATLSYDQFIYLFNKNSSTPVWRYKLDGYPTSHYDYSLDISSDGKYIAVGGRHRIYLFDRDIIKPPKLIIPGYNLFLLFFMIIIMVLFNLMILYWNRKKITKKLSI